MEVATAGFGVRATRLLVAALGAYQDRADAVQATVALVGVKRQRADQRVGRLADLAQGDRWVFPPAAAPFGERRTSG